MRVQILTNAEKMFIEDTPYEAGELQFTYLVGEDKVFPSIYLELEKIPYRTLCLVVCALVGDGDFHTLEDVQALGYLELQREETI